MRPNYSISFCIYCVASLDSGLEASRFRFLWPLNHPDAKRNDKNHATFLGIAISGQSTLAKVPFFVLEIRG